MSLNDSKTCGLAACWMCGLPSHEYPAQDLSTRPCFNGCTFRYQVRQNDESNSVSITPLELLVSRCSEMAKVTQLVLPHTKRRPPKWGTT